MKKRFTIALFSIIFFISYSHSNEINVTSERLEIDREKRTSTFYGSVYFYNNDMEVWADKVIISFDDNDDKIKEIFAENNVKIIRNDLIVTGTKGFYNPLSENIKMIDNVEIIENGNIITCEELDLDIKNSISIMKSSSSKRVEALITNNE